MRGKVGAKPDSKFAGWKLDLAQAAGSDPRLTDGQFRMFFRVLQTVNEETGFGIISDETLGDEVPSCRNPKTCQRNRKRLEELGYWEVQRGHGGRASRYTVRDAPVNAVLDDLAIKRDKRNEEKKRRRLEGTRKPSARKKGVVEPPPSSPAKGVAEPVSLPKEGVAEPTSRGAAEPPVHLRSTPSPISLSELNVSSDSTSSWDEEDWQAAYDERAAILEFDGGYTREEAEVRAWEELGRPLQRHAAE